MNWFPRSFLFRWPNTGQTPPHGKNPSAEVRSDSNAEFRRQVDMAAAGSRKSKQVVKAATNAGLAIGRGK